MSLMNPVLKLLIEGGQLSTKQMAQVAGLSETEVKRHLEQLKKEKIFLGWRPVLDLSREASAGAAVRAVIEVKITPEREGGFNKVSSRIARFSEVQSVYLMSGAYDLLLFVAGRDLKEVASFVSEKLATIDGVVSTATHIKLKTYKEHGVLMEVEKGHERLQVSP